MMSRRSAWSPERSIFSGQPVFSSPSTDPFCGRSTLIPDSDTSASLRQRYNALAATEKLKDELIKDLLEQLEVTEKQLSSSRLDHDREIRFNRDGQMRESQLQSQLQTVKNLMDREAFVLVLLDGDGLIFREAFLQKGEEGGREAANQLMTVVRDHVARTLPQVSHPKIMTRIYANVGGLAETCWRSGITDQPGAVEDFIQGFNASKLCFDFVDCGSGKERADSKIHEYFKIYLHNVHCLQIFLGCSHDNGYARLLEELLGDARDIDKVTLLEGVPFEKELVQLKDNFKVVKFQNIFRDSKLVRNHYFGNGVKANGHSPGISLPNGSPKLPVLQPLARVPSNTDTSSTNSGPTKPATWASMTATPFVPTASSSPKTPTVKTMPHTPGIERNRLGQRIDKLDFSIPNDDIRRVKKLKLCNPFFLQGECKNKNCTHDHDYKLSRNDKKTLEYVARMTPCYYKTECDDPSCIYGHRCPQNESDRKDCYYKENCRFHGWGHGIDTRIVKTTKV